MNFIIFYYIIPPPSKDNLNLFIIILEGWGLFFNENFSGQNNI